LQPVSGPTHGDDEAAAGLSRPLLRVGNVIPAKTHLRTARKILEQLGVTAEMAEVELAVQEPTTAREGLSASTPLAELPKDMIGFLQDVPPAGLGPATRG
jgi:hypothetical protein